MNIAIDFDDTLMDTKNVQSGYRMGPPIPGAVAYTRKLANLGHIITIFTARNVNLPSAHKAVADWLEYYKIPHHGITNIKQPYFDVMIDNRGLNFNGNWTGMLGKIEKFHDK